MGPHGKGQKAVEVEGRDSVPSSSSEMEKTGRGERQERRHGNSHDETSDSEGTAPGPLGMEDGGLGLVTSVETAQAPTLETTEQGALPLPDPWDRFVGRSLVSVTRRVPSRDLQGEGEV